MQAWVESDLGAFCLTCFAKAYDETTEDIKLTRRPEMT